MEKLYKIAHIQQDAVAKKRICSVYKLVASNVEKTKMKRKFFGTNKLADDFKKSLTEIEKLDGGWTKIYLDEKTGDKWMEYVIDPDRGYFWNLMNISPKPNTDELIHIALESEFEDEIHASSVRLFLEEQQNGLEYRQKLIDKISEFDLTNLNSKEKKRIEAIIQSAQLNSEFNYRQTLGKHISEINKDWEFFKGIAEKANRILDEIKGKNTTGNNV